MNNVATRKHVHTCATPIIILQHKASVTATPEASNIIGTALITASIINGTFIDICMDIGTNKHD